MTIDLEELFTSSLILLDGLATYFLEIIVDDDLRLIIRHPRLCLLKDITYSCEEILETDLIEARSSEVLADA